MSNLPVEKARIDAVFGPNGDEQAIPLDPCPVCEAVPEDSPEAVHDMTSARKHGVAFNSAKWVYDHCWRCGFRPGTNVNRKSTAQMRSEFEHFMQVYQDEFNKVSDQKGIAAPSNDAQVADLKRQIEELRAERAAPQPAVTVPNTEAPEVVNDAGNSGESQSSPK